MGAMKFRAVVALWLVVAPSWGLTVGGVEVSGLEFQSSLFSIQNAVGDAAPDPVANTLGVSLHFRLADRWLFRPEVQAFTLGYRYADGRAIPESAEWDNVTILGLLANPSFGYRWPLGSDLAWTSEAGLGLLLRFPVFLNGKTAGEMALPATQWLMAGRLLYPNVGTGIGWRFSPSLTAHLRVQLFYPVFNLWGGLPWYDQLTLAAGIGLEISL